MKKTFEKCKYCNKITERYFFKDVNGKKCSGLFRLCCNAAIKRKRKELDDTLEGK